MTERILLFIPMYNCENQIVRVLDQLKGEILEYISEVIIVNNRSTDNGEQAVITYLENTTGLPPVHLLRNQENYGLGGSHKVAFQYAIDHQFDYVIVLHGDDQGKIQDLLPYLKQGIYKDYDSLLGARFMRGSKLQGYSKFRTFGNRVYNLLFSLGVRKRIYDLGSGLNLYRVEILKNGFYHKYADNLVFNYCMILGAAYYRHRIGFFPISWREDDQVSNVKMVSQAVKVLRLLTSFILNKERFVQNEYRENIIAEYKAQIIYSKQQ